MTTTHRTAFRNRVLQLQREEYGGNFEEALMAAIADEFGPSAPHPGDPILEAGAKAAAEPSPILAAAEPDQNSDFVDGLPGDVKEALAKAPAASAVEVPRGTLTKKKRGRPRKNG